jgi:hypothetical protein
LRPPRETAGPTQRFREHAVHDATGAGAPAGKRKGSLLGTVKTIAWSFVGVRKPQ